MCSDENQNGVPRKGVAITVFSGKWLVAPSEGTL